MLRTLALVLLLAAVNLSCGSGKSATRATSKTTVEVENRNFNDMTVYVIRESLRQRLGVVSGNTTRTFPLPDFIVSGGRTLRFQADPIGGRARPISRDITVFPGDKILFVIPAF
ncbi:hypothetical protein [Rhodocaloribacter sp.]